MLHLTLNNYDNNKENYHSPNFTQPNSVNRMLAPCNKVNEKNNPYLINIKPIIPMHLPLCLCAFYYLYEDSEGLLRFLYL